jgi:hypothetical protein|tara:strand:+ start:1396 stop:2349 length:954 start_codon:yes stop_codon:yes gene_type:complete
MQEKYSASEWATMEGGHSLDTPKEEPFSFIKNIHEARMLRDEKNARVLTYTDCCERLYLSLLCLELMRHYPKYSSIVRRYATTTTNKNNYSMFRMFSTDLHNFIYYVDGDEEALDKLKDPDAAKALRTKIHLPTNALNRYLSQLSHNTEPTSVSELFLKLERELQIRSSDYKSIRRLVTNIKTVSIIERQTFTTRLLFAVRAKLRSSDLISDFEKFVKDKNLETKGVKDTEPTISVVDKNLASSRAALQYYRLLVGSNNAVAAKRFLDLANAGRSIPSTFLAGYMPIITMIDDMVTAGPEFVQALKVLHNRAKKRRK